MALSNCEAPKVEDQIYDANGDEFHLPDYTISQVRAAIPKHCYHRSALRSLSYAARNVASYFLSMWFFETHISTLFTTWEEMWLLSRMVYIVLQSLHMAGLWVLGHECGHQAFSTSRLLNDTVGYILHSSILVPYFSWKISHGKHHKATNNLGRDMGFVPKTRQEILVKYGKNGIAADMAELVEETPFYGACRLVEVQVLGWWAYLLTNRTSHNRHEGQKQGRGVGKRDGFLSGVNHFCLSSPIFDNEQVPLIFASNVGLLTVLAILAVLVGNFGWRPLMLHYFLPYILLNSWIVLITSLQHSDPTVPYYQPGTWNWTRGSAATIDRDFGFVGRYFLHSIIETHVLHHHVPTIPFYHAAEASEAIKGVLGRHYRSDTRGGMAGFFRAAWTRARYCRWIEPTSSNEEQMGVLFYKFPKASHRS